MTNSELYASRHTTLMILAMGFVTGLFNQICTLQREIYFVMRSNTNFRYIRFRPDTVRYMEIKRTPTNAVGFLHRCTPVIPCILVCPKASPTPLLVFVVVFNFYSLNYLYLILYW
jgi:hypothetical protein